MFGYVRPALESLTEQEKSRYRSVYCGLCRTLGDRYGITARIGLTYDMTFLAMLIASLYEPTELTQEFRCFVHPWKRETYTISEATEYAADMTVLLVYHKCVDDWKDDKKLLRRGYAGILKKAYTEAGVLRPKQADAVEQGMKELLEIEQLSRADPDAAANCFGRMLSEILPMKEDRWQETLQTLGYHLGRFVYMMDATMDLDKDRKKENYNPVLMLNRSAEDMREPLMLLMGGVSTAFERLPLVQDGSILKNIIYSGVWQFYNRMIAEKKEAAHNA